MFYCSYVDSPRHWTDQPRAFVEEVSGTICVPSEGNAGIQPLPGGILDGCP